MPVFGLATMILRVPYLYPKYSFSLYLCLHRRYMTRCINDNGDSIMLWIILICLIIAGVITNNFTPLKVFGKIMAWFFGILLALYLIVMLILFILAKNEDVKNKKQEKAYWEKVKQTPLIQWACDSDGYQLYLGERPHYVYQCSTGKLIAVKDFNGYACVPSYTIVNHWKFCKSGATRNTKYEHLLGN